MKLLIIEDDENIVDYIKNIFKISLPKAKLLSTNLGQKGVDIVKSEKVDAVLLDLGLPDIGGFDVLKNIRSFSSVPIIILTVREEEADIVKGLEMGADDYVKKPFQPLELLARIRTVLRRAQPPNKDFSLAYGALRFNSSLRKISYGEKNITLTKTEGLILYELMAKRGGIITPSELVEEIWGKEYQENACNIKTYIYRLRNKLEKDPSSPTLILTIPGEGYYLAKQQRGLVL